VVNALGQKNFAHFIDLNKQEQLFNLPYQFRIKMCDETERRIQYLISKSKEMKVPVTRPADIQVQNQQVVKLAESKQMAENLLIDFIEQDVTQKEQFVTQQVRIIQEMQAGINKLVDYCHVLSFVANQSNALQSQFAQGLEADGAAQPLLAEGAMSQGVNISFVAGTIKDNDEPARM
jgi:vacuolar-type H+-ATPase subunit I/STV1